MHGDPDGDLDADMQQHAMSDAEGLMWRLEKDPHLSSTFGTVILLDRPPDHDSLRRRVDRATIAIPRLRQRVMPMPANLAPPVWVDDPDFDLDHHLRRIACPKPGTERQLLDLATLFLADPLDRARPLWQFLVVEGLKGGKAALVQKIHHTLTDGERGVELALHYLDFERDAPEPPPLDPPEPTDRADHDSARDVVRDLLTNSLRIPTGVVQQVRELLADPSGIPDATSSAARTFTGIVEQITDHDGARSPLWTKRSLQRRIETASAPFRPAKDAATKLGGTLNTAFLTTAAHAAAEYHAELGAPVESLRASMVVSTRTSMSASNAFTIARFLVPTGEMPIDERFRAIHEATTAARESTRTAGLDTMAAVTSVLPTSLLTRLARQQAQTIDFATSNVKGSPITVYLAGAEVLAVHPVGPLAGVAFNLTLLSYQGSLDMALNIDPVAVAEPGRLAAALGRAWKDFARV